ncbi:MAG: TRAP transporter small permease [Desulfobacterales bacterium]|nr:TRAP transporter small permease [Desulfobacterales bacterium]
MKKILDGIDRLSDWMVRLAAVVLGMIILLILAEIFLWNTLEISTMIADEYSAYGLAAIVFLGAGYTLKENGHIRITLIVNHVPQKLSRLLNRLSATVSTVFMGYLLFYLFKMISGTFRYQTTSGTLTNTSIWIPQAIMFIGAVTFFIQLVGTTIRSYFPESTESKTERKEVINEC